MKKIVLEDLNDILKPVSKEQIDSLYNELLKIISELKKYDIVIESNKADFILDGKAEVIYYSVYGITKNQGRHELVKCYSKKEAHNVKECLKKNTFGYSDYEIDLPSFGTYMNINELKSILKKYEGKESI
jgi:hypothetical protein